MDLKTNIEKNSSSINMSSIIQKMNEMNGGSALLGQTNDGSIDDGSIAVIITAIAAALDTPEKVVYPYILDQTFTVAITDENADETDPSAKNDIIYTIEKQIIVKSDTESIPYSHHVTKTQNGTKEFVSNDDTIVKQLIWKLSNFNTEKLTTKEKEQEQTRRATAIGLLLGANVTLNVGDVEEDDHIKQLKSSISVMRNSNLKLKMENEKLKKLEKELEDAKNQVQDHEDKSDNIQQEMDRLNKEKEEEKEKKAQEIEQLQKNLAEKDDEYEKKQKEFNEKQEHAEELQKRSNELNDKLKAIADAAKDEMALTDRNINSKARERAEMKMRDERDKIDQQRTAMNQQMEQLQNENRSLEEKKAEIDANISKEEKDQNTINATTAAEIEALQEKLEQANDARDYAENKVKALEQQVDDMATAAVQTAEETAAAAAAAADDVTAAANATTGEYEDKLDTIRKELKDVKKDLEGQKNINAEQQNENTELQESLEKMEKARNDLFDKYKGLFTDIKGLIKPDHKDLQAIDTKYRNLVNDTSKDEWTKLDELGDLVKELIQLYEINQNELSTQDKVALEELKLEYQDLEAKKEKTDQTNKELKQGLDKVWKEMTETIQRIKESNNSSPNKAEKMAVEMDRFKKTNASLISYLLNAWIRDRKVSTGNEEGGQSRELWQLMTMILLSGHLKTKSIDDLQKIAETIHDDWKWWSDKSRADKNQKSNLIQGSSGKGLMRVPDKEERLIIGAKNGEATKNRDGGVEEAELKKFNALNNSEEGKKSYMINQILQSISKPFMFNTNVTMKTKGGRLAWFKHIIGLKIIDDVDSREKWEEDSKDTITEDNTETAYLMGEMVNKALDIDQKNKRSMLSAPADVGAFLGKSYLVNTSNLSLERKANYFMDALTKQFEPMDSKSGDSDDDDVVIDDSIGTILETDGNEKVQSTLLLAKLLSIYTSKNGVNKGDAIVGPEAISKDNIRQKFSKRQAKQADVALGIGAREVAATREQKKKEKKINLNETVTIKDTHKFGKVMSITDEGNYILSDGQTYTRNQLQKDRISWEGGGGSKKTKKKYVYKLIKNGSKTNRNYEKKRSKRD